MGNITNFINNIKSAVFGKDVRQSICDAIKQCYDDAIANGHTDMEIAKARKNYNDLNDRFDSNEYQINLINSRVTSFSRLEEGSTTGDAELMDIRIGTDGLIYDSAGDSVRTQLKNVNVEIDGIQNGMEYYYMFDNKSIDSTGEITESNERLLSAIVPVIQGEKFFISEKYKARVIPYDKSGKSYNPGAWTTEIIIDGTFSYCRINIKSSIDNEKITAKELFGKIETDIKLPKRFLKVASEENVDNVKKTIKEINDILIEFNEKYDINKITPNKYLDENGQMVDNASWCVTDYVSINREYVYKYNGITHIGSSPVCGYYDEEKNFICSFKPNLGKNNLIVPDNAYYVKFSLHYDDYKNFSLGYYSTKEFVLKKDVKTYNKFSINNVHMGKENMCWSWWYYPQVVSFKRVRNKVYWGYTSHEGYTGIAEYDFDTKIIKKNNLKVNDVDDHNGLALYVLDDGTIICAYAGGHNSDKQIHIRISTTPESIEEFKDDIALESSGLTSYSQLFFYNEKIYVFYRVNNTSWRYRYSSDRGITWSDEITIITSNLQYYCKFIETTTPGLLRICMYSNPGSNDSNIRHGFIDLNTGNIYNSNCTTILGNADIDYRSFDVIIANEEEKTQRLFDVAITDFDKPRILYATFSNSFDSIYKIFDSGNKVMLTEGGEALWHNKYQNGCAWVGNDKIVSSNGEYGEDRIKLFSYKNGQVELIENVYAEDKGEIPIRNARPIVDINKRCYLWQRGYYNISDYTDFNMDAEIRFFEE